ncbi:hypothetical protein N7510_010073 [Penicillium lagena]|uniref:uncharacterized protein n=1 Tax=Penicillium lagena TaxID=94218 RepID=UPI00254080D9|nr:uncharacterized protein N7510_010073 [Penicillium lagena]KAJ5604919.1 hypothetical protein N7510_010073 [Penicillium lagena]
MFSSSSMAVIAAAGLLYAQVAVAAGCQEIENVLITHYGAPDNSPPGPAIGTNCYGHNMKAGADDEFDNCELIYIPLFRKYFYKGDSCAQCQSDWSHNEWHVDLWTGSTNENGGQAQINCEDNLPGGKQVVIRAPPTNLPVNSKLNAVSFKLL